MHPSSELDELISEPEAYCTTVLNQLPLYNLETHGLYFLDCSSSAAPEAPHTEVFRYRV